MFFLYTLRMTSLQIVEHPLSAPGLLLVETYSTVARSLFGSAAKSLYWLGTEYKLTTCRWFPQEMTRVGICGRVESHPASR